jgi:hypothetical protein
LTDELKVIFPHVQVQVVSGHEPGSYSPEHARIWCTGGSVESISRLLKHVTALDASTGYEGRSLILEDDVRIDNTASLTTAMAGDGVVELAGACAYCLDSVAASKILACLRMAPKNADFQARFKEALALTGMGSRAVHACSDGSTLGLDTPSVRSGKKLAADCTGPACTLSDTERLLKAFPLHPYASLVHAAKLKESGDLMGAMNVCRTALDTFRTKPDGSGDTPLVRFAVALYDATT